MGRNNLLKLNFSNSIILLLSIFLLFPSILQSKQKDIGIIIDGSGSMRGFYNTGAIQNYISKVKSRVSNITSNYEMKYFFEKQLIDYKGKLTKWGQNTYLDTAYDNLMKKKYNIVILITDNLQDTPRESENTIEFYKKLSKDEVKKLYFIPKFLNFKNSRYNGKKGILTYVLLFDDKSEKEYEDITNIFNDEEKLLIKPITKNEIEIIGTDDEREKPNAKIVGNGNLIPFSKRRYPNIQFGKKNKIRFNFMLSSKLNHIDIGNNDLSDRGVKLGVSFPNLHTKDKAISKAMKHKNNYGVITPPHLVGALHSNGKNNEVYSADIEIEPILNWGVDNFWELSDWDWSKFWFKNYKILIYFNIQMDVPPKYFSLTNSYKNQYFTNNKNVKDKIYSPTDIIRYINTNNVDINLEVSSN